MPRGPKGEKRPRNAIESGMMVARIATKEIEDNQTDEKKRRAGITRGKAKAAKGQPSTKRVLQSAKAAYKRNKRALERLAKY